MILLPGLIALTIKLIPKEVWEDNKKKAAALWEGGKMKKWYYALPIIGIWLIIVYAIIKALLF